MSKVHGRWLLLLHQIPPHPPYSRAKVLRRLNQLGALPIKNSAYLLPAHEQTLEDLQWVRREIQELGGDAWLFKTEAIAGLSDQTIIEDFRSLCKTEYGQLAQTSRKLVEELRASVGKKSPEEPVSGSESSYDNQWRKLKRRYEEIRRVDFFGGAGNEEVETLLKTIDGILQPGTQEETSKPLIDLKGRTWLTRRGIMVDRVASAWLIRRFIDPAAQFMFVDPEDYRHRETEIRFDMFDGEFTHKGDLCTFEVLLAGIGDDDPALRAVAEVVHDIDLKDAKYQRPEAPGIALVIEGIALRHAEDTRRLEEGAAVFESLYAQLCLEHSRQGSKSIRSRERSKPNTQPVPKQSKTKPRGRTKRARRG